MNKKIIVFSEGPPPIDDTPVEGGGLRAWGIAKSLSMKGFDVTYAYRASFDKISKNSDSNVKIIQWHPSKVRGLLRMYGTVVIRYSMGEMDRFIKDLSPEQVLIADCYIPIAIEFSAREVSEANEEMPSYLSESYWWQECLRRADYFLYASDQQLSYYLGLLSSILKINPVTYGSIKDRLIKLPYGYFNNEIVKEKEEPSSPTLVWYGAIYPWFDMKPVVDAAKLLKKEYPSFKMIIAGARNPYTSNKDFINHYEKSMELIKEIEDFTEIIGHTPYRDRFKIYNKGTSIITINKEGLENNLAWRTRLADYIAAKKPIITNGGDPLGELAIANGIAVKIDDISSPISIKKAFEESLKVKIKSENTLLKELTWENNIEGLVRTIKHGSRLEPQLTRLTLRKPKNKRVITKFKEIISYSKHVITKDGLLSLIKKIIKKPFKIIRSRT